MQREEGEEVRRGRGEESEEVRRERGEECEEVRRGRGEESEEVRRGRGEEGGEGKRWRKYEYLLSCTCVDSLTRVLSKLSSALKKHTDGRQCCGQTVVDLHSPGREEWEIEVGLQGGRRVQHAVREESGVILTESSFHSLPIL